MSNMTDVTNLKDSLIQACAEILPTYAIDHRFMCELSESSLNSAEPINILVGLTKGLNGNIVLGLTKEAALDIISGMMGGIGVDQIKFDELSKSALCEFMTMLCGSALSKVETADIINTSSPTIAMGDKIFLLISRAPSKKVFFKMGQTKFNIAYCVE